MRYTAEETYSAANRIRRQTELRQIAGWSDCQLTADTLRLQMNHVRTKKEFWHRKRVPCRWTVSFPDENAFPPGQGYLSKLVTKINEIPRRLRVPSLNKIAQTATRPSPLWEFRATNCFRDFIVASQNENPR